jgi:hypothetical protein
MRLSGVCGALLALPVAFWAGVAPAADQPSATNMIFDHKHLSNVEQGKQIAYRFNRTVSDAKILGQPFSDDITSRSLGRRRRAKDVISNLQRRPATCRSCRA